MRGDAEPERGISEAWRFARATLAGIVIAFVMVVASPRTPLTYPIAIGLFVMALVLFVFDD